VTSTPDPAVATHRRDALLAVAALVGLATAAATTVGLRALLHPAAVAVGVVGAVAVEWLFLAYPGPLLSVWERPAVALAGTVAVAIAGLLALARAPWLLGALCWGLLVYLLLLACVLAGAGNPVAALVPGRR
jgi:hypothetical protein